MMTNLSPERVTNAIIAAERENYLFHLGAHQPKKTAGLTQLTIVPPAGFGASALNLAVATARGVQFTPSSGGTAGQCLHARLSRRLRQNNWPNKAACGRKFWMKK